MRQLPGRLLSYETVLFLAYRGKQTDLSILLPLKDLWTVNIPTFEKLTRMPVEC